MGGLLSGGWSVEFKAFCQKKNILYLHSGISEYFCQEAFN